MAASRVGGATAGDGSTASALTLSFPAGSQAGDVAVVVAESLNASSATMTTPAGWTLPNGAADVNGGNGQSWLIYRQLTSADTTAGSVTLNFSVAQRCLAVMSVFTGATATGIQVATSIDTASNTSLPVPSIASVTAGSGFLAIFAFRSSGSMPDPDLLAGYSQGSRAASTGASPFLSVEAQYKVVGADGTYGGESGSTAAAATGVAYAVALPASGGAPPPPSGGLNLSATAVSAVYVGSTAVSKVYLGSTQVWP